MFDPDKQSQACHLYNNVLMFSQCKAECCCRHFGCDRQPEGWGKELDEAGVLDKVMERVCHGVVADNGRPYTVKLAYAGRAKMIHHCLESITQLEKNFLILTKEKRAKRNSKWLSLTTSLGQNREKKIDTCK